MRTFKSFSFRRALNASRFDCCWSCWCGPAASMSYGNGFRPDWLNKGGSMLEPIKYRWWRSHCSFSGRGSSSVHAEHSAWISNSGVCQIQWFQLFGIFYLLSLILSYFLNCGNGLISYLHLFNHINSTVWNSFKFRSRWMFAPIFTHDGGILIKPRSKQILKLPWHGSPCFFVFVVVVVLWILNQ